MRGVTVGVELRPSAGGKDKDTRKGKRSRVLFKAVISVRGREFEARIRDLSSLGVLVEMDQPPALGTKVLFSRARLSAPARVAWAGGNRAGLEFESPVDEKALLDPGPGKAPKAAQWEVSNGGLTPGRPRIAGISDEERRLAKLWARQMGLSFDA
jgi:PilZ domain